MSKRLKLLIGTLLLAGGLALAFDIAQPPRRQLVARLYVSSVRVYQAVGRPLLQGRVACRFRPTCSDYSIEAVQKFGIARGLILTEKRVRSCTNHVAMGTRDAVP